MDASVYVEPQFRPAGIGTRSIAYLIDILIQIGVVLDLLFITGLVFIFTGKPASILDFFPELENSFGWWPIVSVIIGIEIITTGYFVAFEYLWNGATPGKISQRIRVVRQDGGPISFVHALIRNVFRSIDILGQIYPLGLVIMFIDSRNRRLGDLAARTTVIMEPEFEEPSAYKFSAESRPAGSEAVYEKSESPAQRMRRKEI